MNGLRVSISWALALALAGVLLWVTNGMLFPPEGGNVLFPTLAERSGQPLWEPTGRFVIALAHVLAAVLLLIPFTRLAGAFLTFAIAGGAVATHFLWLRDEVAAGVTGADLGVLLYLAIASVLGALALCFAHPSREFDY